MAYCKTRLCEIADGRINDEFYVLEYPDWVNVIAVTTDGDFVMVEQYRHGLGEIQTELCAGASRRANIISMPQNAN